MFTLGTSISRGHALRRGVLAAAIGIICLVWPGLTIGVAVALFAIYCFAEAIAQGAKFYAGADTSSQRLLTMVLGLVDIAAGVIAITAPGITAGALVIVIGVWAILGGGVQLGAAWRARGTGAGWLTVGGLLSVSAGVLLLTWPGIGAVSLVILFDAYLVSYGLTLLLSTALSRSERVGALA